MHIDRITRAFLGLATAALSLVGCGPAALLDAVTPQGNYVAEHDLAYGTAPRQRLDVYRPPEVTDAPVIVFFYGGSWRGGERSHYRFIAERLTRHGVVVVIPDYRIYPDVDFPVFVQDGALAMRWVRENAARFGGDNRRIFLMGHSAGAHITALLALDGRYLAGVGVPRATVRGMIGVSGPYDFLPFTSRGVKEVFSAASDLAQTQPITFVDRDAPPMLLVHGLDDATVYPRNSEHLAARLREVGVDAWLSFYPDRGHVDIMLGLSSVFDRDHRLINELLDFLKKAEPARAALTSP